MQKITQDIPCKQDNLQPPHSSSKLQQPPNQQSQNIQNLYKQFSQSRNLKLQQKYIWKICELCYNNINTQKSLAELLHLPFVAGPISLNPLPLSLIRHNQSINKQNEINQPSCSQLQLLFNYVKNVKEYYFCWVIYFNEQLNVLNLKLFKKEQIRDHQSLFNPLCNLIGMYINRTKKHPLNYDNQLAVSQKQLGQYAEVKQKGRCQTNVNTKSTQSLNNSTNTTFKINYFKDSKNDGPQKSQKGNFKKNKLKIRSISPKNKLLAYSKENKGLSVIRKDQNLSKYTNKDQINQTVISALEAKSKSKSYVQLLRSKSKKIKQINIPSPQIKILFLKQLANKKYTKTKLKKQSKVKKIDCLFNRPNPKNTNEQTK